MQVASVGQPAHVALEALPHDGTPDAEELRRIDPWRAEFEPESVPDLLWELTRDCLEDLGIARLQRIPQGDAPWRSAADPEAYLLAMLDAVLSYGPGLEQRLSVDALPIEEPGDAFARVLVAGSIRSGWSLRLIEATVRAAHGVDEETLEAATLAVALGAHPQTSSFARTLLTDPEPALRAAGFRLLDIRGEIALDDFAKVRPDAPAPLLAAALTALRHPRIPAEEFARWNTLLEHPDERVVAAALETGVVKRSIRAHATAVAACDAGRFGFANAAILLGLCGDERDSARFKEWLENHSDPELHRGAGYFGLADLIPPLIDKLAGRDAGAKAAAAEALQRITGAALTEEVTGPVYDDDEKPFVDNPDATRTTVRPAETPDGWRSWIRARPGAFVPGHRYRHGHPFEPPVAFRALDHGSGAYVERQRQDFELRILAGDHAPHLSVFDWVARQTRGMVAWEQWLAARAPELKRGFIRARA